MKKLFVCVFAYGGFLATGSAEVFELVESAAFTSVSADYSRSSQYRSISRAPDGFTSYDASVGRADVGFASQSIDISADTGVITAASNANLIRGFSTSSTNFANISFEVFEATSYGFDFSEFDASRFSSAVNVDLSGAAGNLFSLNRTSSGSGSSGSSSGVLDPGVYRLSTDSRLSNSGSSPTAAGGQTANSAFTLSLGGEAGVPEASQAMCFLVGSMIFLFAGTRRRSRL